MEIWIEDVAEQLSLARILRDSDTVSGKRIAMILVDNVVEFVIKVHGEAIIPGKVLKRVEWDEKKRHFEKLVGLVLPRTKVSVYSQEILDYHDLRNSLYHGTVPLSVDGSKIDGYRGIAEGLLRHVFNIGISEDAWKLRVSLTRGRLSPSKPKIGGTLSFTKTEDNLVKFDSASPVKDRDAIRLVMHGFKVTFARSPTLEELSKSLNYSGHSIKKSNLLVHISRLRKIGRVERKEYALTSNGRKRLTSRFSIV
jgi:hypothetical protein